MSDKNSKLVVQFTKEDFIAAIREALGEVVDTESNISARVNKHYVYGIQGIADLMGVSTATASRIKASGVLNPAISQVGKTIICDADLALDLLKIPSRRPNLHARALGNRTKSNIFK